MEEAEGAQGGHTMAWRDTPTFPLLAHSQSYLGPLCSGE